jgi:hypothetical protein
MTTQGNETLLDVFINDKGELCKKVKVGDKIELIPLTKYSATATPADTPTDFNERFKGTDTFPNDFKALATKVLEKKMHAIVSNGMTTAEWREQMIDKVLHIHGIMGIVAGYPNDILDGKCEEQIARLKKNTALAEFFGMLCKAMGEPWDKVAEKYRL